MTTQRVRREAKRHRGVKILRLRDGRHVARWLDPVGGAQKQESLDKLGLTNDEARRRWARAKSLALADVRRSVSLGVAAPTHITPREAADECLATFANAGTKAARRVVLDDFVAWCAEAGVRSLADLAGVRLMKWRDRTLSPARDHMASTRVRRLADSRHFLRWAVRRGYLPSVTRDAIAVACEAIEQPAREIEFLRPAAARAALEAAIAHDALPDVPRKVAPLVLVLLLSGMRIAEAIGLLWSEIDFDESEIRLPASRVKTKRGRAIGWRETPWLGALLRRMHDTRDQSTDRVFPNLSGPTWASALRRMVDKCKLPAGTSAHTFRRTTGTVLTCAPAIYAGASVYLASRRQGHSVKVAEAHYLGQLRDLPATATTLEAAIGVEDLAERIVAGVKR